MTTALKSAPLSVWRPIATDTFLVGAPHYPEHVDESYWQRDAERMAAAGFNATRLGEFAWHIFEAREGVFDFDLFDRASAQASQRLVASAEPLRVPTSISHWSSG